MKSLLLTCSLFFSATLATLAQSFYTSGGWTYSLNEANEATIVSYDGPGGAIVLPASLDGRPVKDVGYSYHGPGSPGFSVGLNSSTPVTSLVIHHGVTNIISTAFSGWTNLTSVTIPESVTNIGSNAFKNCTALTNVAIPNRFIVYLGQIGFPAELAANLMVRGITERIIAALPENHGIATKADLDIIVSNTIAEVQHSPNNFNLFTASQQASAYASGFAAGKARGKVRGKRR